MRTPTLSLLLLTCVAAGCTGDTPTAVSGGGRSALASTARSGAALPLHGALETSHTAVNDFTTGTALIHVEGTGTATHLGRFTMVADVRLDFLTGAGPERMTLTAANRDVLFATGTGQAVPGEDGQTVNTLESMTITGGTGRFAGATGSFVLTQVDVTPNHSSSASFDGTITLSH
ncbi:MAG TPA: hypothetical protein VM076_20925 [Gemmatimonadaceae bacterium]|nr:hypothetical protein [Gemmatimonadaceae bacterium]